MIELVINSILQADVIIKGRESLSRLREERRHEQKNLEKEKWKERY